MCAFSKRFYHPALNLANNQFCGLPKFNMTKTAILWTSFQPYVPRITSVVMDNSQLLSLEQTKTLSLRNNCLRRQDNVIPENRLTHSKIDPRIITVKEKLYHRS